MKLNSAQLEAFSTVAKSLNFTRAAETLHVTQSALSQRIAKLEEELETSLFIRERTSIRLTEFGEQVLRFCQISEMAEADLLEKLKGTKDDLAGILKIGGFSSVNNSLIIPSLKKLMTKNNRLALQLIRSKIQDLHGLLKSAEVDYIVTIREPQSSGIESLLLGYEENVLVKSKKAADSNIFLDHDEHDPITKEYFHKNKLPFQPSHMRYLDDVYGLIEGVKHGFGKAVLPAHLIENEKDLEILDPKRILKIPIYLQFYMQPYYRRMHAVVLKDIQEYFAQNLR